MKILLLLISLYSFNVFSCSVITGGITHHWSWANFNSHQYRNKIDNKGLIHNPMLGVECNNTTVFGGKNSIGKPMGGAYYQYHFNPMFSLMTGGYIQDRLAREEKVPKLRGAIEYNSLDIVPIVGMNTEVMITESVGVNLAVTPAVNVLYLKWRF